MPQRPVGVANLSRAQVDRLYFSHRVAQIDHITHAVLVLDQHEDPAEEVLDQALGPEPQRNAHDPGTGDERPQVHIELAEGHDDGDEVDADGCHGPQYCAERLGTLLAALYLNGLALLATNHQCLESLGAAGPVVLDLRLTGQFELLRFRLDDPVDRPVDRSSHDTVQDPGHEEDQQHGHRSHQELGHIGKGLAAGGIENHLAQEPGVDSAGIGEGCGQDGGDHSRALQGVWTP